MDLLAINEHSLKGWSAFRDQIGFVPDPMILRAGEIFLNGHSGTRALEPDDRFLWQALHENIGGIIEFFDFVVTRDTLPLISYEATFRPAGRRGWDALLPGRTRPVAVNHLVYQAVKQGALESLAELDPAGLKHFGAVSREKAAFRYDWNPSFNAGIEAPSQTVRSKLEALSGETVEAAQYLLSGLIFDGFAQASRTTHYIQPKRSRFYAALTVAAEHAGSFSFGDEDGIFKATEDRFKAARVEAGYTGPLPPVLPFLLDEGEQPRTVQELLDRALAFRDSGRGRAYREAVRAVRGDGTDKLITEDMAKEARREAIKLLAPYSDRPDAPNAVSLEAKIPLDMVGIPGGEVIGKTEFKPGVPTWLRVWWNVKVPFGGIRKTLRRMWMASESYQKLSEQLREIWLRS